MSRPASESHTMKKMWHVLMQNGRCVLCGQPIFVGMPTHTFGAFSFEHKEPQVHGGAFGRLNRAGSHNECNKARKDSPKLKLLRPMPPWGPHQQQEKLPLIAEGGGLWWTRR